MRDKKTRRRMDSILTGAAVGIIMFILFNLAVDWALFGTVKPCKTVTSYKDGSSVQVCSANDGKIDYAGRVKYKLNN